MANYFKSNIPQQAQAFVTKQQTPDQLVQNMTNRFSTGVSNLNRGTTFQQMQASEAQSQGYNIQDLIAYQQAKKDAEVLETAQRLSEGNQAAAEQYIEQVNRAREAQAQQKQSEYDTWQNAQAMSNIEPKKEEGGIKWWHIALGAGVVGGVAWYLLKEDKPSSSLQPRYNPFLEYDDEDEDEDEDDEIELMNRTITKINTSIAEATKNISDAKSNDEVDTIMKDISEFLAKCKKSVYNIEVPYQVKINNFIKNNLDALQTAAEDQKNTIGRSISTPIAPNAFANITKEIGNLTNHSANVSSILKKISNITNESKRGSLSQLLQTKLDALKSSAAVNTAKTVISSRIQKIHTKSSGKAIEKLKTDILNMPNNTNRTSLIDEFNTKMVSLNKKGKSITQNVNSTSKNSEVSINSSSQTTNEMKQAENIQNKIQNMSTNTTQSEVEQVVQKINNLNNSQAQDMLINQLKNTVKTINDANNTSSRPSNNIFKSSNLGNNRSQFSANNLKSNTALNTNQMYQQATNTNSSTPAQRDRVKLKSLGEKIEAINANTTSNTINNIKSNISQLESEDARRVVNDDLKEAFERIAFKKIVAFTQEMNDINGADVSRNEKLQRLNILMVKIEEYYEKFQSEHSPISKDLEADFSGLHDKIIDAIGD